MNFASIRKKVQEYYAKRIEKYGATPAGVDWNSAESQDVRFQQLMRICVGDNGFSINDVGCGYGALYGFLQKRGFNCVYHGYDLSESMVEEAMRIYVGNDNCHFMVGDVLIEADYSVSSGIFNVKLDIAKEEWERYTLHVLNDMNMNSRKGFSFNMLTSYCDEERTKDYLHYGDPCFYFDYCKTHFSKNIALLHDYDLFEFSVLVKKAT